jgi:hypothetical protein
MKEIFRGESTISLEAAVLKCPNAGLYLYLFTLNITKYSVTVQDRKVIDNNFLHSAVNSCTLPGVRNT